MVLGLPVSPAVPATAAFSAAGASVSAAPEDELRSKLRKIKAYAAESLIPASEAKKLRFKLCSKELGV